MKIRWDKKAKAWSLKLKNRVLFKGNYEDVWFRRQYFEMFPEEVPGK